MKGNPEFIKRLTKVSKLIKAQEKFPPRVKSLQKYISTAFPLDLLKKENEKEKIERKKEHAKAYEHLKHDPKHLNVIYSLLNVNNTEAIKFWRAFAYFLITRQQSLVNSTFSFQQLISLLRLAYENHTLNNNSESSALLESLEYFIASNGLLPETTKHDLGSYIPNKYSHENMHDFNVFALQKISDEILDDVAQEYKNAILQAILEFNGILTISSIPTPEPPVKKDIDLLEKLNLVQSEESFLEQQNDQGRKYFAHTFASEIPENADDIPKHPFTTTNDEHMEWTEIYGSKAFDESWMEQEHRWRIRAILYDLRRLRDAVPDEVLAINDKQIGMPTPEERGSNTIHFDNMLDRFGVTIDRDTLYTEDFNHSFNYLIDLLEAVQMVLGRKPMKMSHLALLTQLSNVRSIANDIAGKESELVKDERFSKGTVTWDSAVQWLADEKRRKAWVEPVASSMFFEDITLEFINSLTD